MRGHKEEAVLYHVRMDMRPPHGIDPVEFDRFKAEEKACVQDLQREALGCICGDLPGSIRIARCSTWRTRTPTLQAILSTLPLFPFMQIE
jgi:muconolactone D-isomerase